MPDARSAVWCNSAKKAAHGVRGSGEHPTFPAQWLGSDALSPVRRPLFAAVAPGSVSSL